MADFRAAGWALRLVRDQFGWTQAELADKLHISVHTLQRAESGGSALHREQINFLGEATGLLPSQYEILVEQFEASIRLLDSLRQAPRLVAAAKARRTAERSGQGVK